MNVENIKSELQEVLESDITLRKEYIEVKRSLSDYRNQLIQRFEDCKLLQVSIDVLNTKLLVMERDNTNFKSEVASFTDLRNTINEQLEEKQLEISSLITKITDLESQLQSISAEYDIKMTGIQAISNQEIADLKLSYESQLQELKSNTSYQQNGMRSELELKISELTASYDASHQETVNAYELQIETLTQEFTLQIETLKSSHELSNSEVTDAYELKISSLLHQLEEQRSELTNHYETRIVELTSTLQDGKLNYETDLNTRLDALQASFTENEQCLIESHQQSLAEIILNSENTIENLKSEYELKLSDALSNSSNDHSKLTDDLSLLVTENEHFKEKIKEMVYHIDNQNAQIEKFTIDLAFKTEELVNKIEAFDALELEFSNYKVEQSTDFDQQHEALNSKLTNLESSLNSKNAELIHLSELLSIKNESEFQTTQALDSQKIEFEKLLAENTVLISEIDAVADTLETTEEELTILKTELFSLQTNSELKANELKEVLSSKNFEITNLSANNSALETEIQFLKSELEAKNNELISIQSNVDINSQVESEVSVLQASKNELENHVNQFQFTIAELNNQIFQLSNVVSLKDSELDQLKQVNNKLADDSIHLLNEQEDLSNQLLKMHETISGLSHQVEFQDVNISELDNHRKNVILANGSSNENSEKTIMKKQINELVREIDKCIALLSA
jgi:chromosome segregation ATPase